MERIASEELHYHTLPLKEIAQSEFACQETQK
jgi:hypothetical protein